MSVTINFKDSINPQTVEADEVYTEGDLLCVKKENVFTKFPLINILSFQHSQFSETQVLNALPSII